jgi:hypothetical protein
VIAAAQITNDKLIPSAQPILEFSKNQINKKQANPFQTRAKVEEIALKIILNIERSLNGDE